MHIFCGPMLIAPDSDDSLLPYKTNKEFKPRDWNAYTWWTRKNAPNVMTVLNHSHESFITIRDTISLTCRLPLATSTT